MYRTHRAGAIITTLATVQITQQLNIETNIIEVGVFAVACLLGAYFPDVDHPSSHLRTNNSDWGKILRWLMWFPYCLFIILEKINQIPLVRKYLPKCSKATNHRGITHAPIIYLVLVAMFKPWRNMDGIEYMYRGFFLGVLSHLILDFFSGGIPLLYPFRLDRIKCRLNILTDSEEERKIYYLMNFLAVITLLFMTYKYWAK